MNWYGVNWNMNLQNVAACILPIQRPLKWINVASLNTYSFCYIQWLNKIAIDALTGNCSKYITKALTTNSTSPQFALVWQIKHTMVWINDGVHNNHDEIYWSLSAIQLSMMLSCRPWLQNIVSSQGPNQSMLLLDLIRWALCLPKVIDTTRLIRRSTWKRHYHHETSFPESWKWTLVLQKKT